MTHDDLLMLVTGGTNYTMAEEHLLYRKTLSAVVELHKPITVDFTDSPFNQEPDYKDFVDFCISCVDTEYPCSTIKAIELNLQ